MKIQNWRDWRAEKRHKGGKKFQKEYDYNGKAALHEVSYYCMFRIKWVIKIQVGSTNAWSDISAVIININLKTQFVN